MVEGAPLLGSDHMHQMMMMMMMVEVEEVVLVNLQVDSNQMNDVACFDVADIVVVDVGGGDSVGDVLGEARMRMRTLDTL